MPGKFIEHGNFGSLDAIPKHVTVMGKCEKCGSMREIDREILGEKTGEHARLCDAELHLKCTNCGAKAGKLLTGYYISEGGE